MAHTPELQAYTASKLYTAIQSDISQESLTLAAVWIIGEYSDVLLEGGIVDEDKNRQVRIHVRGMQAIYLFLRRVILKWLICCCL